MTPEELAAYREWVRISNFESNTWPQMGLSHIDQQAARIAELEADLEKEEHNSEAFMDKIGEQACYIVDLENQIKALKKIAIKEKASGLFNGPWDSGLPDDCGYDAETEACRTEARRQLAEEHPEAFR